MYALHARPFAAPGRRIATPAEAAWTPETGRHRLWELESGLLCSILGTCLELEELRRMARKLGLAQAAQLRDYELHGYFVQRAGEHSPLSKLVHKTLDRKYATLIGRFRPLHQPEALWALWQHCLTSGDVAGGYWALMTHKALPAHLQSRAHNEVHMLSHLMGRHSRDSLRRVRELEGECAAMGERLAKVRVHCDEALRARDERIRALEARLEASGQRAAAPAVNSAARDARDRRFDRLRARAAVLERRLKVERARARAAERSLEVLPCQLALAGAADRAAVTPGDPVQPPPGLPDGADLRGCAVLYVGGHANVAPRLREQAQRLRAGFIYHDGGIESHNGDLPALVSQADAVFCPVGCVSHTACLAIKQLCKRQGKPLMLLRSAGLSGFVAALSEWAQTAAVG